MLSLTLYDFYRLRLCDEIAFARLNILIMVVFGVQESRRELLETNTQISYFATKGTESFNRCFLSDFDLSS